MEALCRKISNYKERGLIKGINMTRQINVSHLMFINNLLFGGVISIPEWTYLHLILLSFSSPSGLVLNKRKFKLSFAHLEDDMTLQICDIFGITSLPLDSGFVYLGFK